jgi:hypothetical protein
MGYRSQVVLAIGPELMAQFMSTMAKSPEARTLCFAEHDKLVKDYDGAGSMLFSWDHIKWYDSYECIRAIEDFMEWAEGEDHEDKFKFVRTGEDMDDNEQRGWGFDHVYVERSITF